MLLKEAREILKDRGFLLEYIEKDLHKLQEGDELLIYINCVDGDYPEYKATILGLDENVKPRMKGKAWRVELAEIKTSSTDYYIGTKSAFTHGTYGDAIIYPKVCYKNTYEVTDNTEMDSICFIHEEVRFKSNDFNKSRRKYFVTDIEKLNNGDITWGSSNNTISDEEKLEKIFAEHPELKKEYDSFETKFYNLRK